MASNPIASTLFFSIFFFFFTSTNASSSSINVLSYGAKGDGKTESSQGFLRAWSYACNSALTKIIYVPKGRFLVKPIFFSGPCKNKITFQIDGTVIAPSDYWSMGKYGYWIRFYKVNGLNISGGNVDAGATQFWNCRRAGQSCPPGARSISFHSCNNVAVTRLTSLNSQLAHIEADQCNNIAFQNLKIYAPSWSPNTDGIHVQYSTGVTIFKANIQSGDDCISIGPGSKHVWIERISCGPGHGISIGSLAESANEDGVLNVTVTSSSFTGTENGVRIKTWARPSNGFARDINFINLNMNNAHNPIIIDQNYCPSHKGCPNQNSGVKISRVNFRNIRGISATQVAMNFVCSPSSPCEGIHLENVQLSYAKGAATSYCKNVAGSHSGVVVPKSCLSNVKIENDIY